MVNVVILSFLMLSVVILNVVMLSVAMLSVDILNVLASWEYYEALHNDTTLAHK